MRDLKGGEEEKGKERNRGRGEYSISIIYNNSIV